MIGCLSACGKDKSTDKNQQEQAVEPIEPVELTDPSNLFTKPMNPSEIFTEPEFVETEPQSEPEQEIKTIQLSDNIQFTRDQMYAVAFLYPDTEMFNKYSNYDDIINAPHYEISDGEYYLIIPRYSDMKMELYQNDMETENKTKIYETKNCKSFIIRCNISDIFPDATIKFTRESSTISFSPFISLKDGTVQVGEFGLNLSPEIGNPEPEETIDNID